MSDPHPQRLPDKEDKRTFLQKVAEFIHPGPDSTEELIETLAEAEDNEIIGADSRVMLERVIRMADMTAGDVMVAAPRMDLVNIEAPFDELLRLVINTAHSRFPVYQGERENIIGILMAKDLLKLQRAPELNIRALLRPAAFVPETKGLNDLLREFRGNRNHLAIVIDEFGRVAGLITIEDVLEQIVGEIEDEFDPDNKYLTRLSRREWLVDGRFSCDDAIELGWPLEESDDYETIAGWILELCDSVPDIGEVFEVAGYKFKVQSMRGQRISLIRVIAPAETDKKDSESSAEKPAASGAGSADPHDGDE